MILLTINMNTHTRFNNAVRVYLYSFKFKGTPSFPLTTTI